MTCDSRRNSTLNSALHTFHFVTQIMLCVQIKREIPKISVMSWRCENVESSWQSRKIRSLRLHAAQAYSCHIF